jgi:NAD+ diphosphatase
MQTLAYMANSLDRSAVKRNDDDWIAEQRRSSSARFIHINGDKTIFRDGRLVTDLPLVGDTVVFLGLDDKQQPWFACRSEATEDLRDLRSLALEGLLPDEEIGILAQARSLIHWHERRSFCSNCGGRNEMAEAGYRRHCPHCKADHFPRTDPVVIMVARHKGRLLLGRQAAWTPGMYSALAGFVEPGETLEDAARREVFEESGIRVGPLRYAASQPWPFPASLMIGLIGEALSDEIVIDHSELEDARWFPAEEAKLMMERRHPQGFTATNPRAIAYHLIGLALQSD